MTKVFKAAWMGALLLAALGVQAKPAVSAPAASAPVHASCSWDRPGHNPFMGDVVGAVDRYPDIPADVRQRLKARMAKRQYDEVVSIRRDSIEGRHSYEPGITGMHFGQNQVCRTVTRDKWTPSMQERGLVYCESGHCILVPTVCRNVSRITRMQPTMVSPMAATAPDEAGPLAFAPPGAGPLGGLGDDPAVAGLGGAVPGAGALLPIGAAPRTFAQGVDPGAPTGPAAPGAPGGPGDTPVFPAPAPGENPGGTVRPPVLPPGPPVLPPPAPPVTAVPEPGTWLLMLAGLAAVAAGARRRRRA